MQSISTSIGEGRYRIELTATLTGEGISILLTGGEKPHVGAVVMSVPRNSLSGKGISCDTWILPVPGHKDAEVARPIAEMICRSTGQTVVVTAGIHIDKAESRELEILLQNSLNTARQLVNDLKEYPTI